MYPPKKIKMKKYSFGNNGLLEAVKNNEIKKVRVRLGKGADVNFADPNGDTSLHIAAGGGGTSK
jgi:ankyrin repeat protein